MARTCGGRFTKENDKKMMGLILAFFKGDLTRVLVGEAWRVG
jgi:hypothetical protein